MRRFAERLCLGLLLATVFAESSFAQRALTWREVRDKFHATNPTLRAGEIGIEESRAQEITAYLRPNPNLTLRADQLDPSPSRPPHGTFAFVLPRATGNSLPKRRHKRDLRLERAQKATKIAISNQADLERM